MSRLRKVLCRASRAHFAARKPTAGFPFSLFHFFNLSPSHRFTVSPFHRFVAVLLACAPSLLAQNGPFDFGDAPAPYPTLLSANGAYHQIVQGIFLGDGVTADRDGQPDPNANLDLADDGVTFLTPLVRGNVASLRVFASVPGKLDAWIDFNGDGDWLDSGEQIFTSLPLAAGPNTLNFLVPNTPASATASSTFARFRFSTAGDLQPTGFARDGEVEDYRVQLFGPAADLSISVSISPDSIVPPNNGRCSIGIINLGPSIANNVWVSNFLSGVEFLSIDTEGSCRLENGRMVCFFGSLAPHETRSLSFTFHPIQPFLLADVAIVQSDAFDPNLQNNRATATVRAAAPLIITTAPKDQRVIAGMNATFFVQAKGVGALKYQWFANGAAIAGATDPLLILYGVQQSADIQVQVSDAFSTILSPIATLSVVYPAQITAQPRPISAHFDSTVQFAAKADGTAPLSYQWRCNGANIPGATNPVYVITHLTRADCGMYTLIVANDAGVTRSDSVPLLCQDIPFYQGSDNIANAVPLPPPGVSPFQGAVQGNNSDATKELGEPDHDDRSGSASIWYLWTAPIDGIATIDTIGSTFDTLLAVYTGTSLSTLKRVASDDDAGGCFRSLVRFNAGANQTYLIAVDGRNDRRGVYVLGWNLEQAPPIPVILTQPKSQAARRGAPVTLSVEVAPGSDYFYRWFLNGRDLQVPSSPTYSTRLTASQVGSYMVRVSNAATGLSVDSRQAIVEIGPVPTIVSRDKPEDIELNGSSAAGAPGFAALAELSGLPPFISVSLGIPGSQTVNNVNSTADIDCFTIGTASRWLGVQVTSDPAASGCVLRVDTSGSAVMTELAAYRFIYLSCLQDVTCMHTNIMSCDTNSAGGGYSLIQFPPALGGRYLMFADGLLGAQGIINFNWQLGIPPVLDPSKSNCTLVFPAGTNVTLMSGITNASPAPSYQWYLYGAPLSNETNSTLSFSPIQSHNAGCYSVVASNLFGIVTNQCCVIVDPPELRCRAAFDDYPASTEISAALLPGSILQATLDLTPKITWDNVVTNTTTNCYFLYAAPMFDTNGVALPPRFYRTLKP